MTAQWSEEDVVAPLSLTKDDLDILLDNGYTIKDGDTIVSPEGETIRVKALNSPETAKTWKTPPTGDQFMGQEAKNATAYALSQGENEVNTDLFGSTHGRSVGSVNTGLGDLGRFQVANHYSDVMGKFATPEQRSMQRAADLDYALNPDHPVLKYRREHAGVYEDVPLRTRSQAMHRKSNVDRALSRSVDNAQQGLYGLAHMIARGVGSKEGQRWAEEGILRQEEELRGNPASVPSYTDIDSIGDAGTYVTEKVIENASMLGMGGVGGLAARVAGRGAAKQATKQAMLRARRQAVPDALRAERIRAAQPALTSSRAAEVTRQKLWEVGKGKSDEVLNKYTKAGATAGFYPVNAGETEVSQMNLDNPASPLVVAAAGAVKSALDMVGIERVLTSFFGAKQATGIKDMAREVIKAAGVSGATESVTETMQTAVDIVLRGIQDPSFDPLGPEAIQEFKEAAVAGGVTGGFLGAISGGVGSLGGEPGPGTAPPRPGEEPPAPAPPSDGGNPDIDFRDNMLSSIADNIRSNNSAAAREAYDTLRSVDPSIHADLDQWFDVSGADIKWKPGGKESYEAYQGQSTTGQGSVDGADQGQSTTGQGSVGNFNFNSDDGVPNETHTPTETVDNEIIANEDGASDGDGIPFNTMSGPIDFSGVPDGGDDQLVHEAKEAFEKEQGRDTEEEDDTPVNVRHGSGENAILSNLAPRAFTYEGREYKSVEHAYQTLKSGKFDEATFKDKEWEEKDKVRGRKKANQATNRDLMKTLMKASFEANPEAKAALLATGKSKLTHTGGKADYWTNEFPAILTEIRSEYGGIPQDKSRAKDTGDYSETVKKLQEVTTKWFSSIGREKDAPTIVSDPNLNNQGEFNPGRRQIKLSDSELRKIQSTDSTPLERAQAMDVFAHEVGHALSHALRLDSEHTLVDEGKWKQLPKNAGYTSEELKNLKQDFKKWKDSADAAQDSADAAQDSADAAQDSADAAQAYDNRRSPIGQTRADASLAEDPSKTKMDEWFADQVGHYLLTGKHGLDLSAESKGVIERIADSIIEFYNNLMRELGVADKEVAPSVAALIERQFAEAKAKPEYPPVTTGHNSVTTIISGGQTGGDIAGIRAGQQLKREGWDIELGGVVPKGYRTEDGSVAKVDQHIFTEDESDKYPPRTKRNVLKAGATIAFNRVESIGTISTIDIAKRHGMPHHVIMLEGLVPAYKEKGKEWEEYVAGFAEFLATNENVHSLNIAGIRGRDFGKVGADSQAELEKIIQEFLVEGLKKGEKTPSKTKPKREVEATTGKSRSYGDAVDRTVKFLNHYGFEVSYAERLLVNMAHKEIEADLRDPVQLAKALAEPLATMMSRSHEFTAVRRAITETEQFKKEVAALLESNTDSNAKRAEDKAQRTVTKEVFQRLLEDGISDKLSKDYNITATLKAKILKFIADVKALLEEFTGSPEWPEVKAQIKNIVDNTFEGDDVNFIRATEKEGYALVDLQESFNGNKLAHSIMSSIGTDPRAVLTGSIAYAPQGPMYRPQGSEVHDLDFIFDGTRAESESLIKGQFESSELAYDFTEGGKNTMTYIVPPKGHTITEIKRRVEPTLPIKVGRKGDPKAQYIGRGSPLGNPFPMKGESQREEVIAKFRGWLNDKIAKQYPPVITELERLYNVAKSKDELILGCFCSPKACHGDYIKEVLNEYSKTLDWDKVLNQVTTGKETPDTMTKVMSFEVMKGDKVVGTYDVNPEDYTETKTGVEAVFVDFFHDIRNPRSIDFAFNTDEGKVENVKLSHFGRGFEAKLAFGRLKDIWDYNRFMPDRADVTEGSVEADILNATQGQAHQNAGYDEDGEVVSGDTDSQQVDPRLVNFRVNGEGPETNWEQFREGEPIMLKTAGFKSVKGTKTLLDRAITIAKVAYGTDDLLFIRRAKGAIGEYIDVTDEANKAKPAFADDPRTIMIVPNTSLSDTVRYKYKGVGNAKTLSNMFASMRYDQFMELSQQVTIEKAADSKTGSSWVVAHRNDTRDAEINASKLLKRFELMKEAGRSYRKNKIMLDKIVNGERGAKVAFDGYKIMRLGLDLNGVMGVASVSDKKEALLTGLTVLSSTDVGGRNETVTYDISIDYRDNAPDPSKLRSQRVSFIDQWVKVNDIPLASLGGSSRPFSPLTVEEEATILTDLFVASSKEPMFESGYMGIRSERATDEVVAKRYLLEAERLSSAYKNIKLLVNKSFKNKDAVKARKQLLKSVEKHGVEKGVQEYLGVDDYLYLDGLEMYYVDTAADLFTTALNEEVSDKAIKGVDIPYWLPRLINKEASKSRAIGKRYLAGIDIDGPYGEVEERAIEILEEELENGGDTHDIMSKLGLLKMHRENADYETRLEGGTNDPASALDSGSRLTSANPPLKHPDRDGTIQRTVKFGADADPAKIGKRDLNKLKKTHDYTSDKRAVKLVDSWKKLLGIDTQVVMADMEGILKYIDELKAEKARLIKAQKKRDARKETLEKKKRTDEEHEELRGLNQKLVTEGNLAEFDDAIKMLNSIVVDGAEDKGILSSRVVYMDKYKYSKLRVPVIYVPSAKQLKANNKAKIKELKAQIERIAGQRGKLKPGDKIKARKDLQNLEAQLAGIKSAQIDVDIVKALAHEFGHLVQRVSLDQLLGRTDKDSQVILREIFGEVNWADDKEATAARERFADMFIHWVDGRPEASDAVNTFFKGILEKLKRLVQSLKSVIIKVGERGNQERKVELKELEKRRDEIVKEHFEKGNLRAAKDKRAEERDKLARLIKNHDEDINVLQGILSHIWKIAGVNADTEIGIGNPKLSKTFNKLTPNYTPVAEAEGKGKKVVLDSRWWEEAPKDVGVKGKYPAQSVYEWLEAGKPMEGSTKVSKGDSRFVQGYSLGAVAERMAAEIDARDRYKGRLSLLNHEEAMLESELKGIRERISDLRAQLKVKPKSMDPQISFNAFLDAMVNRHIVGHPDKYVEAARSLSVSTTMHRRGDVSGVKSAPQDFFIGERVVSSARDSRVGKATLEHTEKLVDKLSMFDPLYKSVDRVLRAMGSPTATAIAKNFRVQGHETGVPTIPEIIKGYQQRLYLDMRVHGSNGTTKVGMIETLKKIPDMPTWFDKKRDPDKARRTESKLKSISLHLVRHTPISSVPRNIREEVTAVRTYFKAVYGRYGQDLRMEGTKNYFPLVLDTQGKWIAEGAKEKIIEIFLAEDRRVNSKPTMTEVEAEQLWQEIASHDGQVDPGVDVDAFVTSSFRAKYRRVFTPELSKALAGYYVDDINTLVIGYTDALAKRLAWQRQYGGYAFDAYGRPIMELGVGGELRHRWHPTAKLEFQLNYAVRSVNDPLTAKQANWIRFKALEAYKGSLGADMNPTVRKAQAGVLTGLNTSLLSGASLTSLPDLAGIYIRLGETDGFKRSWKGLQDTMRYLKDPKYAEEAKSYASMLLTIYDGMVDHTLASSMEIGYMPTAFKRINDKFFRAIGLKRWTDFTRIAAVQVAKDDIRYLAKQNDAKSAEKLARLGLTKKLVQDWVDAGLDQNTIDSSRVGDISIEIRTAINRWVDEAIMRPDAQTRPYYGSDHRMAMFFYLRGFMWSFYETIWHQTMVNMGDAKGAAKVLPLIVLGATVMPLAAVGYELRKLLFGKLPAEALDLKDTTRDYHGLDYLSEVARRAGLYGPLQLIDDANTDMERGNRALANFMGVPFGVLVKMLDRPEDVWKFTPVLNQSSTLKAAIGS